MTYKWPKSSGFRNCLALGALPTAAAVGAAFAILELGRLRLGGLALTIQGIASVVFAYSALAVLVAALVAGSCCLLGLAVNSAREKWRSLSRGLPLASVLFVFTATLVNVRLLPSFTSPTSLAADLALLLSSLLLARVWSSPRSHQLRQRLFVGGMVVVVVAAGAWMSHSPAPRQSISRGGERRSPDVVIVLVDTLRADHLGAYGYGAKTSPFLDEFARQSLVFDHAYSTSNWTRPAVASLFTSTMPSRHGVTLQHHAAAPEFRLLAEPFSENGYSVGFFTSGGNVTPADGYARGVDYFYAARHRDIFELTAIGRQWIRPVIQQIQRRLRAEEDGSIPLGQIDPGDLVERALSWVNRQPENRPVFLYVHLLGPHSPYAPPTPFGLEFSDRPPLENLTSPPRPWVGADALSPADRRQMVAQYDGEILWHDQELAKLVRGLRAASRLETSIVVITSDHGEAFGEHGTWGHNAALFDELTRIPLLLWASDDWFEAGRLRTVVSLIDLAPTLLETAGIEPEPTFDGSSILSWIRRENEESRFVFFENPENDEFGVRTELWSYFEGAMASGRGRWLYRADDEAQGENLAGRFPDVVAQLRQLALDRRLSDEERAIESRELELEPGRIEQLKALGYLQ